ncbi:FAD-binding protein, partial [Marinitenerispora sediminis]
MHDRAREARVGDHQVTAAAFVTARSTDELVAAVVAADAAGDPLLVLGGGSNLVVSDAGFPGTVVHVASEGIDLRAGANG